MTNYLATSSSAEVQETRLISQVLTHYYMENMTQSAIANTLGLSTAKVNRLLMKARREGLVEIKIRIPFQQIFDLEKKLELVCGVQKAIVVPAFSDQPQVILQAVGKAAASLFTDYLKDGETICMGGGQTMFNLVQEISTERKFDVNILPALGGVQGRNETDVNNLASLLAKKVGGKSMQLHAPAFTDTPVERDAIINMRQVKEVLDIARRADIALVGVGDIAPVTSSFFRFTSLAPEEIQAVIKEEGGVGEILAHVINLDGKECKEDYTHRVVGIALQDLKNIPMTIGIAALENKVLPVVAALRGGFLKAVVLDENTAKKVLEEYQRRS